MPVMLPCTQSKGCSMRLQGHASTAYVAQAVHLLQVDDAHALAAVLAHLQPRSPAQNVARLIHSCKQYNGRLVPHLVP